MLATFLERLTLDGIYVTSLNRREEDEVDMKGVLSALSTR